MALSLTTFTTATAVGIREDLTDVIYRITPTLTPFMNMCAKSKATSTLHEWQTQDLASAASNAVAEGADASTKTVTPTVRLQSRTQISTKSVSVSGTQSATIGAGRGKDEMAYQMSLAALELKRDMEYGLLQQTSGSSPRAVKSVRYWVTDNTDNGGGSWAAGAYNTTDGTAPTDGTQRAFTEAQLKNVLQKIYTAGGDPDTILLPPAAKQTFSTFTGNATRFDKSEDAKLYASIDVYVSDFGELTAVPSRFQRTRDVFVLQSDKWALAYLRPFQPFDLATTGDAVNKQIVAEYAIEARAPKANGWVADIL
jgi:hypothetical protein